MSAAGRSFAMTQIAEKWILIVDGDPGESTDDVRARALAWIERVAATELQEEMRASLEVWNEATYRRFQQTDR